MDHPSPLPQPSKAAKFEEVLNFLAEREVGSGTTSGSSCGLLPGIREAFFGYSLNERAGPQLGFHLNEKESEMETSSAVRTSIAAVNERFMRAFGQGDASGVAALYTEDGQLLPPGSHVVTGRERIGAFWKGAMEMGIERVELRTLEVEHQGDTAMEVGRVTLYGEGDAKIDDPKYMLIWKRREGQWRIHRDMWNSDH